MSSEVASAGAIDAAPVLRHAARAGLIALPFLFPFTGGPSANVWQLLASWGCLALLCLVGPVAAPARRVVLWLAVAAASIGLLRGPDAGLWLPACVGVGVIGLAACVGAGLARADRHTQGSLAWGLLGAGVVSAALGLLQYYELAAPLLPWTTTPALGQSYGNLRQRNQFATLIGIALVAALWLYAGLGVSARRWLVAAMLLLALAVAASTSRTGLLQWIAILGVAAFIAWRERRQQRRGAAAWRLPPPWLLLGLIGLYFAASWVLPLLAGGDVEALLGRLRQGAPAGHSRLLLWHNVLSLIGARPWAGWGWGELAFAHYSTLYAGPRFVEILDNAHNLPLHLAVELGVPAALTVCAGFAALVLAARPWRERAPTRLLAWGVLGAIVLHSLLEYPLWYGPFQLVFGLCLGLLWPAAICRQKIPVASVLSAYAAIVLIAIVGTAAWDYTRISQLFLVRAQRLPAYRENTLAKLQGVSLFANQRRFAELALTPLTQANAQAVHALARQVVHFSPEPNVIAKLIDSCVLLGLQDEAQAQMGRFKIAFPLEYARWLAGQPVEEAPEAQ